MRYVRLVVPLLPEYCHTNVPYLLSPTQQHRLLSGDRYEHSQRKSHLCRTVVALKPQTAVFSALSAFGIVTLVPQCCRFWPYRSGYINLYFTRSKVILTRSVSEGCKSQSLADASGYNPARTGVIFDRAEYITGARSAATATQRSVWRDIGSRQKREAT